MKLLLDQNLSFKIVGSITELYPDSARLRDFDLQHTSDELVWEFAKNEGYVIVTKDDDFQSRSLTRGFPPKVVHLRIGNCPTGDIIELLRSHYVAIRDFYENEHESLLVLGA